MKLNTTSELLNFIEFLNSNFYVIREVINRELKSVLRSIKLSEQGVFVQASTLGSLEALLEFLKTSKIPVSTAKFLLTINLN